jgi:hypothetical protein
MPEKKFSERIKDVALGLATLKVTTCVGDIQAKAPAGDQPGLTKFDLEWKPEKTRIIRTEVDLVAGDANNFVHESYEGDGNAAVMREYHERQVARAQDVVQRNVDLMIKVFNNFKGLLD